MYLYYISLQRDQNGVSLLYINVEIHHSGRKLSICRSFVHCMEGFYTDRTKVRLYTWVLRSPYEGFLHRPNQSQVVYVGPSFTVCRVFTQTKPKSGCIHGSFIHCMKGFYTDRTITVRLYTWVLRSLYERFLHRSNHFSQVAYAGPSFTV